MLSRSYWKGFLKRNKNEIETGTSSLLDKNHSKWTTFSNFDRIYSLVYQAMVDSRVTIKLEVLIYYNKLGEECTKSKAFGYPCYYRLVHKQYILFFDEVGCNLKGDKNGNVGGPKFIKAKGAEKAQNIVSAGDCRYTTVGFTAVTGEPVLAVIIIQAKKLEYSEINGLDVTKIQDSTNHNLTSKDVLENIGTVKLYPQGPVCHFCGVRIPAIVTCSEDGGINADILTDCLRYLDKLGIYDRSIAIPMLICDGHQTRFNLVFMKYTNTKATRWNGAIGVLYGTHIWQVGDSEEQNRTYKMMTYDAQSKLINWKIRRHLLPTLLKSNTIPIINIA